MNLSIVRQSNRNLVMPSVHVDNLLAMLPPLPAGIVVVINTETGEFTTGKTEEEALDAFEKKYEWGVPAYIHVSLGTRSLSQ
jgi:hypothetical protein